MSLSPYLKPKALQTSPSTMILMRGPLVFIQCHSRSWSLHVIAKTHKISPLLTKMSSIEKHPCNMKGQSERLKVHAMGFLMMICPTWKWSVLGFIRVNWNSHIPNTDCLSQYKWGYCGYKVKILHLPVLHVSGPPGMVAAPWTTYIIPPSFASTPCQT